MGINKKNIHIHQHHNSICNINILISNFTKAVSKFEHNTFEHKQSIYIINWINLNTCVFNYNCPYFRSKIILIKKKVVVKVKTLTIIHYNFIVSY